MGNPLQVGREETGLCEGFCVSGPILLVKLRCGGPWITEREVAGRLLPGILIVVAFVIGLLRAFRIWFASFVGRTAGRVRGAASGRAWR